MVQYIDQPTAAGYALKYARELCLRDGHLSTADCNYRHAKMETENKDGWWFVLSTDDGREQGVIADRRGTLEAIAPYGANMPARRAPDRAPAAP